MLERTLNIIHPGERFPIEHLLLDFAKDWRLREILYRVGHPG